MTSKHKAAETTSNPTLTYDQKTRHDGAFDVYQLPTNFCFRDLLALVTCCGDELARPVLTLTGIRSRVAKHVRWRRFFLIRLADEAQPHSVKWNYLAKALPRFPVLPWQGFPTYQVSGLFPPSVPLVSHLEMITSWVIPDLTLANDHTSMPL